MSADTHAMGLTGIWPPLRALLQICVGLAMVGIMALTVINVTMRYVFNAPISGSDEIVQVLLAILVFSAFPLATLGRRHFSVALLARGRAGKARFYGVALELLVSAAACGVMTVELWQLAWRMQGAQMSTMVLEIPLAPLNYAMSVLSAVAFVGLVAALIAHLRHHGERS